MKTDIQWCLLTLDILNDIFFVSQPGIVMKTTTEEKHFPNQINHRRFISVDEINALFSRASEVNRWDDLKARAREFENTKAGYCKADSQAKEQKKHDCWIKSPKY